MKNATSLKLCKLLDLGDVLSPPTQITGGLLHLMWNMKTTKGEYAVKELNKNIVKNEEVIASHEKTEEIARAFADQGVPLAVSLAANNQSIFQFPEGLFIVYPWIKGLVQPDNEINLPHAKQVASILATIHTLDLQFDSVRDPDWVRYLDQHVIDLTREVLQKNLSFSNLLNENLNLILAWNKQYQEYIPDLIKNLVVTHSDLHHNNVIWQPDSTPILIDWESAGLFNPTQEILTAALDWSGITTGQLHLDTFQLMLSEYEKAGGRLKQQDMQSAFWGVVGNWMNWMIYNIERSLGHHHATQVEQILAIEQVHIVLAALIYLTTHIQAWIATAKRFAASR